MSQATLTPAAPYRAGPAAAGGRWSSRRTALFVIASSLGLWGLIATALARIP